MKRRAQGESKAIPAQVIKRRKLGEDDNRESSSPNGSDIPDQNIKTDTISTPIHSSSFVSPSNSNSGPVAAKPADHLSSTLPTLMELDNCSTSNSNTKDAKHNPIKRSPILTDHVEPSNDSTQPSTISFNPKAPSVDPVTPVPIPTYTICWAQLYRHPYWPAKIVRGNDIPDEFDKKKRTKNIVCVNLFGKNEFGWTSPERIVEFASFPDGPEPRKKSPGQLLLQAIELAKQALQEIQTLQSNNPTSNTAPSVPISTHKNGPTQNPGSSIAKATSSAPINSHISQYVTQVPLKHVSVAPKQEVASVGPQTTFSNASVSSRSNILQPQHHLYIQHLPAKDNTITTASISNGTVPKQHTDNSQLSERLSAYISPVIKSSPTDPVKNVHIGQQPKAAIGTKTSTTGTTSTSTQSAPKMDVVGSLESSIPNTQQPTQINAATTTTAPSKVAAKPRSHKKKEPIVSTDSQPNQTATSLGTGTPSSSQSEPVSAPASRSTSPQRSGAAVRPLEPFKSVEEYHTYRGTASVGHVVGNKTNPLGLSGFRSSSQVDALTVVSSQKQKGFDGQVLSTPLAEKNFIGLQNLGNTCYINSAIQCLSCVTSFCQPLTSLQIPLDDMLTNSSPMNGGAAETKPSRGSRSRSVSVPPPAPPQAVVPADKKINRTRKCKPSDHACHDPEDAKSNPLIASLVGILKTLSHPEHLISHSNQLPKINGVLYNGPVLLGQAHLSRFTHLKQGAPSSSGKGRNTHSNHSSQVASSIHGVQTQLVANSSDEEMDVDPIGDEDEEIEETESTSTNQSGSTSIDEPVPPKEVTKVLHSFQNSSGCYLDEKYYTDQHQDISEFILHLLEYAHDQLNTKKPFPIAPVASTPVKGKRGAKAPVESPRSIAHAADYSKLPKLEMDCKEWYSYMATNQSPVSDSFDGLLRRSRKCPKGHTFTSYEIFRILTLHFEDENAKEANLEDLFRTLRKPEILECRCSSCGGSDNKSFSQETDVYILPKYLIITLGRFKGSASDQSWWAHKIKTRVKFPLDNMDMGKVFEIAEGQPAPVYNLVAVSNHKGSSIHGGHYFSYVRTWTGSDHWVSLNDTAVKEVRSDAIVSNQAYMLFYERKE